MRHRFSPRFERAYSAAPPGVQRAFDRHLKLLANVPLSELFRYPSLRTKKFPERGPDVWQARVTRDWRLYFAIEDDTVTFLDLIPHPK